MQLKVIKTDSNNEYQQFMHSYSTDNKSINGDRKKRVALFQALGQFKIDRNVRR